MLQTVGSRIKERDVFGPRLIAVEELDAADQATVCIFRRHNKEGTRGKMLKG